MEDGARGPFARRWATRNCRPQKKSHKRNGGRHCCQPPLRRAKDLPVFVTCVRSDPKVQPDPFSILAHQLRRRFLPNRSLRGGAWPVYRFATRRIANPSTCLACPKAEALFQNSPAFHGPSWDDLYRVPLCSPFLPKKVREPRRATGSPLFRRLLPTGSASAPKSLNNACRRRSDLWSPAAPSCRCRLSGEAGTAVPIT